MFYVLAFLDSNVPVYRITSLLNLSAPEFVSGLAQFAIGSDEEMKLKFLFRIYDMDRDGYISNGELFQVIKLPIQKH